MPSISPSMTLHEALKTTKIHSVVGNTKKTNPIWDEQVGNYKFKELYEILLKTSAAKEGCSFCIKNL